MFSEEFFQLVSNSGMATYKELKKISVTSSKDKSEIGEFGLLQLSSFNDRKFANFMADKFNCKLLEKDENEILESLLEKMPKRAALKYRLVPVEDTGKKIILTSFDPLAQKDLQNAADILGKPTEFVLTTIGTFKTLYERVRMTVDELVDTVKEFNEDEKAQEIDDATTISSDVVTYVNRILADAFARKASDIHVEPYENSFRIRFRTDGNLVEVAQPPKSMVAAIISRLKILAKLDIAEKRLPQDGRIKLLIGGRPIDYRVSCLPTLFGEKVVLRLLDQSNLQLDMTKLGFMPRQLEVFKDNIHKPFGMCLVTGPTGSGKTTTLYSALAEINTPYNNISTAEDPCEFNLEGINQVNVKKDIGLTFASALKAFLRQDPDIIMVGEIRDYEVGEIAVEAALTGHMVFSTLHTNDAPSTITRLLNMGIEPFLVVAAVNVVVAQRLCKRICVECRQPVENAVEKLVSVGMAPESAKKVTAYKGEGCDKCGGSGYKGRVAVHEVLPVSPRIKELILKDASSEEIKRMAIFEGMRTLRMSYLIKVVQGTTTIEEAVANSGSDNIL